MFHNNIADDAIDNSDAIAVSNDDPVLSCASGKLQQVGEKSLDVALK